MENIIIQVCKYIDIAIIMVYTINALAMLWRKKDDDLKWNYRSQNMLLLLFHATSYFAIVIYKREIEYLIFYGAQVIYFIIYMIMYSKVHKKCYKPLLSNMMLLLSIGFVILARLSLDKALRQFVFVCVASIVTLIVPIFVRKLKAAKTWAGTCGVIGLLLLIVVLGSSKVYGANLSIGIGPFSFQPSEFVKISYVLMVAVLLRNRKDFKRVFFATGIAAVHVLVLVISTDLGGALIYFLTYLCMLYVATGQVGYVYSGLTLGSIAAWVAYLLFSHVKVRVEAWIDPWSIIDNKGLQIAQSLFAIGTGGWFGSGLYEGMPRTIPVVTKDYTFSAISEEMGGIVAVCMVIICICCFVKFMQISMSINVKFYRLIGVGMACLYSIQLFLVVGGVTKFIPSTGVTLPFVSYGGSSIFSAFILFGIMQGLYIMRQNEDERIEQRKEMEQKRELERRKKAAEIEKRAREGSSKARTQRI